ncbi:transferase [Mycolicibacterium sp. CH28]|uniref:transferase n=1 Tax=Mycolicibacterium sp. CH28 TaxID=2512237 RepID=UPI0010818DF7|nr:transferase [Mycolicibacterium sp. CH28]TGD86835.1 transferase [Mycolicibacterium sp. CH28]
MNACRGCRSGEMAPVLDLGRVPAQDFFPPVTDPVVTGESKHQLSMVQCTACGLAQLADDDTVPDEPRGIEPLALKLQAADAVDRVAAAGWLRGNTVREFGSPHGGTWVPLLTARGFGSAAVADVVLDSLGLMHEPDQVAAVAQRAAATAEDGVLLLQYHSLATIVGKKQWNALRHGHFAYYSTAAIVGLLNRAGMSAVDAWEFDLYGGTVLLAAVHGRAAAGESVNRVLADESRVVTPEVVGSLQEAVDNHCRRLRDWLECQRSDGKRVYAYGAASRAVSLFVLSGVTRRLVAGVADASTAKQGRRMPGTDVPIISPAQLAAAGPDFVLLTVPDLLSEVEALYPGLAGRWISDEQFAASAAVIPNRCADAIAANIGASRVHGI